VDRKGRGLYRVQILEAVNVEATEELEEMERTLQSNIWKARQVAEGNVITALGISVQLS